ncbi:hypothetical protein M8494_19825 [Serratia ureilytica]
MKTFSPSCGAGARFNVSRAGEALVERLRGQLGGARTWRAQLHAFASAVVMPARKRLWRAAAARQVC